MSHLSTEMNALPTEQRNPATVTIDEVDTLQMLRMINDEDKKVPFCVEKHLDQIAAAVDAIAEKFSQGGRIVYCGAGTSGRLGFMDSAECPPTFGTSKDRVVSLIAGGLSAMEQAKEDAEDHPEYAVADLVSINFCNKDVLVGLAASGRTPYVLGAVEYAKKLGSVTVSVTCNEDPALALNQLVDYPISIYAGPEVITGSTRMKAGTIQKLVLNMLSTGMMIKTGKVYSNLMVNVKINNEKLLARAIGIAETITGEDTARIEALLRQNNNNLSLTIFMLLTDCPKERAQVLLEQEGGHIKKALAVYASQKN